MKNGKSDNCVPFNEQNLEAAIEKLKSWSESTGKKIGIIPIALHIPLDTYKKMSTPEKNK